MSDSDMSGSGSSSPVDPSLIDPDGRVIAIIGCGTIGRAILAGLLRIARNAPDDSPESHLHFYVVTRTKESADRLEQTFDRPEARNMIIFLSEEEMRSSLFTRARVVILACPPSKAETVLQKYDLESTVPLTTVVSLLHGVSVQDIQRYILKGRGWHLHMPEVIRARPNIAAKVGKCMTVIESHPNDRGGNEERLDRNDQVIWLFELIGEVEIVPPDEFDAAAMLASGSMGLAATAFQGIIDGCVAEGLGRNEALQIGKQMLKGMVHLLDRGMSPVLLNENVSTPGIWADRDRWALEKKGVGSAILSALLDATSPQAVSRSGGGPARITRFVVSFKTFASAERLRAQHEVDKNRVTVFAEEQIYCMQQADIVLFACHEDDLDDLDDKYQEVVDALKGKLVISIVNGGLPTDIPAAYRSKGNGWPTFVEARPNDAVLVRKSTTIIKDNSACEGRGGMVTWIFEQVGKVSYMSYLEFDTVTTTVRSSMAMFTLPLDGILDACVARGMSRNEMKEMFAQVLEGLGGLLRHGVHPGGLRDVISDNSRPTARGMLQLEKSGIRALFAEAMLTVGEGMLKVGEPIDDE
ncbi:pyrroline-5-carboxylate reductase [Aspergillus mulundensis]|uniref:Pyrroline-5-carboxylate reductase n=1 Tax=Aspergillus mulundensis TaxID=1810919 RepID=A0A3D8SD44_9EURO|nr:hypothetical protein DSM5745_04407 [Aspergillus mulundensis]RDW84081.1 hypothetical protein DSM5745_04407 [Aspergillus mulundensis]